MSLAVAHQLAHDPVARGFRVAGRRGRRLEVVGDLARTASARRRRSRAARTARRSAGGGHPAARAASTLICRDPRRDRAAAAAGRARGNSGSRAPLPCCASTPCGRRRYPRGAFPARPARPSARSVGLPRDLELERALHVAERVEVLDLCLHAERLGPGRPHRHVGVAAKAALFHVAVVDADGDEDRAQAAEEVAGVGGGAQVRLGHDLDERHAAAVEVEIGVAIGVGEAVVQRLAGILFEVDAGDADAARRARRSRSRPGRRSRAAARTARSGSPSAGRDRSSSCARRSTAAGPCSRARDAARAPSSTTRRFNTGSAPGSPRQTGQTCVFGGAPNRVLQPQKIFVSVSSWAWISRPMTASSMAFWMSAGPQDGTDRRSAKSTAARHRDARPAAGSPCRWTGAASRFDV